MLDRKYSGYDKIRTGDWWNIRQGIKQGMNSKKALTSLQKENSRGTQGAWKDRVSDGPLEIQATDALFRSATGILQAPSSDMLQAPGPGHENPGESDRTPQASGDTKARWRAEISTSVSIKPNHNHALKPCREQKHVSK